MNVATLENIRRFLASYRPAEIDNPRLSRAGVLVLFFPREDGLHLLLTKRTEDVEHHKGQISFPGGSHDEGDETIVATALRESEEEIGLRRESVQVLGRFDDYETPSGFIITPVVGFVDKLPDLKPNAHEVAEVLHVPVSLFLDQANERVERRTRADRVFDVYFYGYGGDEIWGATAAIIRSFLKSLRESSGALV